MGVGDKVIIKKGKQTFEGIVVPKSDLSKADIILKLDSGYNIGINKPFKIKTIKRKAVRFERFPRIKIKKKNLPNVSLITTGGTIGARVDYLTGGVYMCIKPRELLSNIPELQNVVNLKKVLNPFSVASEDMTYKEWQKIAKLTAKELNSGAEGVIITHGTDTLHYTSAVLSFMLKNLSKPVAVVGAQRSADRGSFDGVINLLCAAHYSKSDIAEVALVMHGETSDNFCYAHRGTKVRKMHTSLRSTFKSINDTPLAKIWPNGKIQIINKKYKTKDNGKTIADTKFEPRIALIKTYPGSRPGIIDFLIKKGCRGIILETTGFGHVPTQTLNKKDSWIPNIKKAVNKNVSVGITSQTIYGRTNPYVYRNARILAKSGAIFLEDILPEVAYIKLGWVLAHARDMKKIKNLMLQNLANEINEKSLIGD